MAKGCKGEFTSLDMLHTCVIDARQTLSGSLAEVLSAVRECSEERQQHVGQIASEVGGMRSDLSLTRASLSAIETKTSDTEEQVAHLHERMDELSSAVAGIGGNVGRSPLDAVPVPLRDQRFGEGESSAEVPERGGGVQVADVERETSCGPGDGAGAEAQTGDEAVGAGAGAGAGGGGDAVAGDCGGLGPEPTEHGALMLHAAGISSVHVICHRDSWKFLVNSASGHEHFCMPWEVCDHGKGRVRAVLSGRSLIAVLISLRQVRIACMKDFDGSWALATTLYRRIQKSLYRAHPAGSEPLKIVLDDGVHDDGVIHEEDET
jgi:hypothetical protein